MIAHLSARFAPISISSSWVAIDLAWQLGAFDAEDV
jgi:hypothetical protein